MVDPAPTLMGNVDPALKAIVDDIKKTAIKEQPKDDVILYLCIFININTIIFLK